MSIKVLIADDHQIMREGLRALLEKEIDIKVLGEAEDGRMIQRMAREMRPDVIIMDVAMPDLNGIEATRQIAAELPGVKIIALSMHDDRRFVLNMLKAGAAGYMLKDCAFKDLAKAIRVVMSHKTFLSPEVADIVVKDYLAASQPSESSAFNLLSPREREVLQLIAEGKTSALIGESLHISIKTVETHRQQIMVKLKIRSVAELTKYAIREGLTSA
ncbi:MAG TPA: response regulator transcription factor [Desulfobaccales bacterium]|nr:response regulator transcription factor [Desulfobaccales bacterium]